MCSVDGCGKPVKQRGWCAMHYSRWYKHGDVAWEPPTLAERFWSHVDRGDGCWTWTGAVAPAGYGRCTRPGGGTMVAHVFAWEQSTRRTKPVDLELDHLCRNVACVRPDHLELVTGLENRRRAGAAKTHCPAGHPYAGDNLYVRRHPDGRTERRCRTCRREGMRAAP